MHFEYYQKILALPMKSTMKGTLLSLAYRCNPKADNLCIPSWDTIKSDSNVSRDVIGKSLRIAEELQLISIRCRGNIKTGKKPNQYFFLFNEIRFYKSKGEWKISTKEKKEFKRRLVESIQKIKEEDLAKGKKDRSAFPVKTTQSKKSNNTYRHTHQKSQKSHRRPSDNKGSTGYSISPDTLTINPDSRPEVIDAEEKLISSKTKSSSTPLLCNNKSQNIVLQVKESEFLLKNLENSKERKSFNRKSKEQTNEEWWEEYENYMNEYENYQL